ncbi:MAG TPA: protein-L-isoaspartate(D-aspartate) O-methyltransferase [Bacteroidales bacterium]|nr:protein-L-isoaspartate(D-aspartate) O-methyltransferase [Bacteroidales bacterium]
MKTLFFAALFLLSFDTAILYSQHNPEAYRTEREGMINRQIADRGIRHPATLDAMKKVPRHLFVPPTQTGNAYRDSPLPIGYGQTISQPYIVAFMTEIIEPEPDHVVLEIGTGSGYQAAVLAEIVNEVYTIEIIPELAESATLLFDELDYKNIHVKTGDGYYGWEESGPFDAIVVTAAAEYIPPPLIAQLKDGGKMIIPVGTPFFVQQLMLVEKKEGKTTTKNLMPVRFVPFTRSIEGE